ncbi:MAG TPA: signal peptidase I [Patescibacteria group bacterium]|nr:signal peptidase I [Patescibacteria group bacterium]
MLIVYVGLMVVWAGVVVGEWKFHHLRVLAVQTGSMAPTFKPGDAVLVQKAHPASLAAGQVVSYISPADPTLLVSHRIVAINQQTGMLTTRGDHAARPDISFSPSLVVGRVSAVVPKFGYIINALHTRLGLIIGVYTPAAIIVLGEIKRLTHYYGRGYYRLLSFR